MGGRGAGAGVGINRVTADSIRRNLEEYVGGGYASVKSAVTPDEFKYIQRNMVPTNQTLYRIEDIYHTAEKLKVGSEFSFKDDIRSFSRSPSFIREAVAEEIYERPVVFKTTGTVKHFNMDKYTTQYEKYFKSQQESLVGGRFKVKSINIQKISGQNLKVIEITQL